METNQMIEENLIEEHNNGVPMPTEMQAQALVKVKFEGFRDIKVIETGKVEVQTIKFLNGWYVPADKLHEIYQSKEPIYSYVEWVLSKAEDEIVEIYDDGSNCDDEPIGTEVVNIGKDHVERFTTWVKCARADGYEIRLG